MKKITALFLAAMTMLACAGCGGGQNAPEQTQGSAPAYAQSLDVLNAVVKTYAKDDLFAMYGGNQEDAVMDAPGKFDVGKTEELALTLGLPESQFSNIEDAASMVHMMNANTFTGAAYRLKEGVDVDAFAEEVQANLQAKQWICGQPDTLLILDAGGRYVVTAYGEAQIMELFKNNALSALDGAKVVAEKPLA